MASPCAASLEFRADHKSNSITATFGVLRSPRRHSTPGRLRLDSDSVSPQI